MFITLKGGYLDFSHLDELNIYIYISLKFTGKINTNHR